MHILLTNDDGPPNDLSSPYIKYLVQAIHKYTNWKLTITVPSSQKSWIGKAHFAGKDLTASYVYSSLDKPEDNSCHGPFPSPMSKYQNDPSLKEWCLIDGTPASCADIGCHHIAKEPVDLVLSGPNVGRNSTALYITSSGTIGAAMEGALMNHKAIGLSYAYDVTPNASPEILKEASLISIKLIENLYNNWGNDVDLYSINVPLESNLKLGKTKIYYTPILDNKWSSLFKKLGDSTTTFNGTSSNEDTTRATTTTTDIVDGSVSDGQKFKWAPNFQAVHEDIDKTEALTDGKVVSLGHVRYVIIFFSPAHSILFYPLLLTLNFFHSFFYFSLFTTVSLL
ncbi:hypothetical protein B5S32_g4807 [[Candida] boidinii]|nr:hypothetical protein B5S29_g4713 [[Candida] boidinii]OWB80523.1 hypothetical protein B5S32_g4807 [[Candida] boidinii]